MNKKNIENTSQFLDVHKAAEYLNVSVSTIRRWAHTKQLKGVKVGIRGDWRFTTGELLNMASANHNPSVETDKLETVVSHQINSKESEHFVQFYKDDKFLLDSLSKFIRIGLSAGNVCVVVATKPHRNALEKELKIYGLDIIAAKTRSQYISLDAKETLKQFMVDSTPDPKRFFEVVGNILLQASKSGQQIQIFGEMVALLWAETNETGAIHLEKLWNDIGTMYAFSLFCAYPMHTFRKANHSRPFAEISSQHARIIPAESYSTLMTSNEQLRAISQLQQKVEALQEEIRERKKYEKEKDNFLGGGEKNI